MLAILHLLHIITVSTRIPHKSREFSDPFKQAGLYAAFHEDHIRPIRPIFDAPLIEE